MKKIMRFPLIDSISWIKFDCESKKPTLIFLHDSLGCIALWRDFPKKLGQELNCNVIVYDRMGYGKSGPFVSNIRGLDYLEIEADILNDLMASWGIENAVLFGHSDGGSIALLMAAKYPDKIKGVISEGAHVFVEDITIKGIEQAVELYKKTDLKARLTKYHGNKTEAMFMAWTQTWLREDFRDWNIESYLKNIVCPVLVIQGEEDEYGTLKQVQRIVNNTVGLSQKLIIPKIGHSPHKEVPQNILEKSIAFLTRQVTTLDSIS
jgi:pimeloyl-ACP methyl ester carboxylesterase